MNALAWTATWSGVRLSEVMLLVKVRACLRARKQNQDPAISKPRPLLGHIYSRLRFALAWHCKKGAPVGPLCQVLQLLWSESGVLCALMRVASAFVLLQFIRYPSSRDFSRKQRLSDVCQQLAVCRCSDVLQYLSGLLLSVPFP